MSQSSITPAELERWANDPYGPVALHLVERMQPVEGEGAVFFPPTYADLKTNYNLDELNDGTLVALVDSVGAQANRIEPMFEQEKFKKLVPQIEIHYGSAKDKNDGKISIFRVGHRLGDALVRCTELQEDVKKAFQALLEKDDASGIAKLAPTSLVFGVWDSRESMAKVPRILQSTVRAWNVSRLTRSAQYKAPIDYAKKLEVFSAEDKEKAEGQKESPLAKAGFVDVPATNSHGGIVARGPIQRDLTLNLVALRRLHGTQEKEMRRYILGLSLVAATEPVDSFYRQGCMLVSDVQHPPKWTVVERNGTRTEMSLSAPMALEYAQQAAAAFGVGKDREVTFSKEKAKAAVAEAKEGKKAKKEKNA